MTDATDQETEDHTMQSCTNSRSPCWAGLRLGRQTFSTHHRIVLHTMIH